MKKILKRTMATILALVMMLTAMPLSGIDFGELFAPRASAKSIKDYSTGDIIEFGWYPQTEETDVNIVSKLNTLDLEWVSYGYYDGTGSWNDGQMFPSDYMKYTDVEYNRKKNRGVKMDLIRPGIVGYKAYSGSVNGYSSGNVYWFEYEPIKWVVLDPSTGYVISLYAIDSQPINNYLYGLNKGYANPEKTYYVNDYSKSYIRNWLNDTFYCTSFSDFQKSCISNTNLENSTDKIFLPSESDVKNSAYGFTNSKSREVLVTDYSKSQSISVYNGNYSSYYRTRTKVGWNYLTNVYHGEVRAEEMGTNAAFTGIRPALKLNLTSDLIECSHETETKLGDVNNDNFINSSDALLVLQHTVGTTTLTGKALVSADVTKDTLVNSSDALMILQYTVGKINKF